MPSITGGGGFIPQPIQPQRQAQVQQAAPAQVEKPQTDLAPKDTLRVQAGPSQTSQASQAAQRLTSDGTKAMIHQLIQTAQPQPPADKPQLLMMERPAMSSALADTLANHHVPDQQQAQQPGTNQQAQQAAGQYQTSTFVRVREHTEDSVARNSKQSGKRVRKEDQEGEFASLEDFGGGGMSGDQSGQDQRSDSQKKKQILTAEEKRKGPQGSPLTANRPAPPKPVAKPGMSSQGMSTHMKSATGPIGLAPRPASAIQPRSNDDKPFSGVAALPNAGKPPVAPKPATKPGIQRVQPPLSQQQKPAPPKKPTDEWTM